MPWEQKLELRDIVGGLSCQESLVRRDFGPGGMRAEDVTDV